jgi:hypothetical protein
MRQTRFLPLSAVLLALVSAGAYAQEEEPRFGGNPMFARPFQYMDQDGPGVLIITPLSDASTRLSFQQIRVTLEQNNRRYTGAGVYHSFTDDSANLPPFALVAFTLVSSSGRSFFFQGRIAPVHGYTGDGTYFPVDAPQTLIQWHIRSTPPTTGPIIDSTPALRDYWARIAFSEAVGGVYYATYNTFEGAVSTATWSDSLPADGSYQVEVFIPRQPSTSAVPRTTRAVYQIYQDGAAGVALRTVNQQVSASGWVSLGSFNFRGSYRIVLTDETGEARGTRSVVANAVRLTPVTGTP